MKRGSLELGELRILKGELLKRSGEQLGDKKVEVNHIS